MANLRLLLLIFLCLILIPFNGSDTSITFIDVGQGDSIYISSGREDILIDGGSSSTKKIGKYTLEPFLKSQRIGSIEKLFVTHADSDHINGLAYLVQEGSITVRELYLPACAKKDENYDELISAFAANADDGGHQNTNTAGNDAGCTRIIYLQSGDVIPLESGSITCMSPVGSDIPSDMNDESLILLYCEDNFSALFTGDASKESELTMLDAIESGSLPGIGNLTLLKVGHHGSRTSTSEKLVEASSPLISVLSYGENNRYGHPHPETTELLDRYHVHTLRTAESGAITVTTDGRHSVHISEFISDD